MKHEIKIEFETKENSLEVQVNVELPANAPACLVVQELDQIQNAVQNQLKNQYQKKAKEYSHLSMDEANKLVRSILIKDLAD